MAVVVRGREAAAVCVRCCARGWVVMNRVKLAPTVYQAHRGARVRHLLSPKESWAATRWVVAIVPKACLWRWAVHSKSSGIASSCAPPPCCRRVRTWAAALKRAPTYPPGSTCRVHSTQMLSRPPCSAQMHSCTLTAPNRPPSTSCAHAPLNCTLPSSARSWIRSAPMCLPRKHSLWVGCMYE
jgi:hypothetical protein